MLAALALTSALAAPPLALARYAEAVDAALRGDVSTASAHLDRVHGLDASAEARLATARWRLPIGDVDGARADALDAARALRRDRRCDLTPIAIPLLTELGESATARRVSRATIRWTQRRRCAV